jgi:radical SAM protein with 4Fe4S-binding SPASM domain
MTLSINDINIAKNCLKCQYAEWCNAACRYTECRYTEYRYAECRDTKLELFI